MTRRLLLTVLLHAGLAAAENAQPLSPSDQDPAPEPLITEESLVKVGKPPVRTGGHTVFGLPCNLGLELKAGHDSNVLLAAKDDGDKASDARSIALGASLRGGVQVYKGEPGEVLVGGDLGYNAFPSVHPADLARAGAYVTGITHHDQGSMGVNLGVARFQATDPVWAESAKVAYATLFASREASRNILLGTLGFTNLVLDGDSEASGYRFDLSPRWWLLLEEDQTQRRVEFITRYSRMAANAIDRSYQAGFLGVGFVYRFGEAQDAGTIDLDLHAGHEWRLYDDGTATADREQHRLLTITGNLDYWLNDWASVGPYAGLEHRTGTPEETVAYDRWFAGLRSNFVY